MPTGWPVRGVARCAKCLSEKRWTYAFFVGPCSDVPIHFMSQSVNYALLLSYDGSDFCGWQVQRGTGTHENEAPSIESNLIRAIHETCGESVSVVSSGRTDAGVHASGQVAHFSLAKRYSSPDYFVDALNERLPAAIRVLAAGICPDAFRANRALRKQYSYYFQQGAANLPHLQRYSMWNRMELDFEAMQEGIQNLVGKHDFVAFSSSMTNVKSTVRTLLEAEVSSMAIPLPGVVERSQQSLIRVRLVGDGFLRQMVRRIAGTLKKVGEGRIPPGEVREILESRDRERSGPTAPAGGLWLEKVWYGGDAGPDFHSKVTDTIPS